MTRTIHAGGALVWRRRAGTLEVLLIHRPDYDDWSWPKGKPRKRETLPACAAREVEEETGVRVRLGVPLPAVRYTLGNGRPKVNHYWAAQVCGEEAAQRALPAVEPAPTDEVDATRWVDALTAWRMLTRRSDREPLKALLDLWADDRLETWAVIIARHGRARKRSEWAGGEPTRPLTPRGTKQAHALVALLAAYGTRTVNSSPWERCLATIRPFSAAAAIPVQTREFLTEDGAEQEPARVLTLVKELIGAGEDAAVCTHRPVLPHVIAGAAKRSTRSARMELPAEDPYLGPGEVLILHVASPAGKKPRAIAAETHHARRLR